MIYTFFSVLVISVALFGRRGDWARKDADCRKRWAALWRLGSWAGADGGYCFQIRLGLAGLSIRRRFREQFVQ